MRKVAILGVLGLACARLGGLPGNPEGEAVLEVSGAALRGGPFRLGSADLARLPRGKVRGIDPATGREQEYEGTPLLLLVAGRVDLQPGADLVVVRTARKEALPIPLPVIRHLEPVLADRAGGARLAERVLAWPSATQPGLLRDPRVAAWWARDVAALEIVEWRRTYGPALAPPPGATDAARRGATIYGERCISCHRMRSVGGEAGPDLTTVASRLGPTPFASFLKGHPGWGRAGAEPPGTREGEDLRSFLEAVAASPSAR